jgi:hypothetical protein
MLWILLMTVLSACGAELDSTEGYFKVTESSSSSGLGGRVFDAGTGAGLPSRIVVEDDSGEVVDSYYDHLPGFFTEEDGSFKVDLAPGSYSVSVFHGIDYLSQDFEIDINASRGVELEVFLAPWVRLREEGWINGDAHAHLYTDNKPDVEMAEMVRRICRGQALDFISACQGWSGWDEDSWREGFAPFSDDRFLLHYGAEMPKYRTGHTFWLGLTSSRGQYHSGMDTVYEDEYYQSLTREEWEFSDLPFPNIPDIHLVPRFKKMDDATAIMPHPTSWWWQKRGEIEKYTTNKVSYLPFALLSDGLWDGMVVMGYDPDHYFYQNLWFSVLNEGYRMTPVAELDGGYEPGTEFYYGSMRTYYRVGGGLSMSGISEAVRKGRTFVTSGPTAFLDIDGQFQIGDVVPADEEVRELSITALASGEKDDYLSYVLVIRNGEIHKLWDLRKDKLRKSELSLEISETEDAWYVVKVYGREAPGDTALLDVMSVCERISDGSLGKAVSQENNIFLSSPFYFRTGDSVEPEPLRSEVRLSVVRPDSNNPVEKGAVSILTLDGLRQTIPLQRGRAQFEMPVNGLLRIEADGYPTIHRSLF